jgi:pimeloyl-ACP methyl ester carboxylesterase
MPKLRANGLDFHYWQSGRGPDVVMLHGLGGNLAGWHLTMVPELQQDWRITTYDLRGHGRSAVPSTGYSTREMAEDLRRIMDVLGIERAHIVGHSWGVDIALHFALLHAGRVRDLVLIEGALLAPLVECYMHDEWEGWPYVNQTIETLSGKAVPEQHRRDLEYLLTQLIEIPIQYGPARGRPRDGRVVHRVAEILRPMWHGRHERQELTPDTLARIRHRSLLIYENGSVFGAAQRLLRERLPSCSEVVLPGSTLKHFSGLEHPELILQHIREFLPVEPAATLGARAAT